MFRQPSKRTIRRRVARDVEDICREVTEEVNRFISKRKRVNADDEGTSASSSNRTWMDVPVDVHEASLWSSAVEHTDDSDGYSDSSSEEEESSTESCIPSQMSTRDRVWEWAIESNIAHTHLRNVLEIFKTHVPDMPTDPRTLLRASYSFRVVAMGSGEYVHIGLGSQLKRLLENRRLVGGENRIVLNLAIDGLPVYRKTKLAFWPILAMVIAPFISAVFPVAIYCGKGKPNDVLAFCRQTVDEINQLQLTGITLDSLAQSVIVRVAAVICDAPARSFVKQIKNVNAYHGCERCDIVGVFIEKVVYLGVGQRERLDDDFNLPLDGKHRVGVSPFDACKLAMISNFPLDPLHLIYLGVVKKLIGMWVRNRRCFPLEGSYVLIELIDPWRKATVDI